MSAKDSEKIMLYDWLKDNPKERQPLLLTGDVPEEFKWELKCTRNNEACLFWFKACIERTCTGDNELFYAASQRLLDLAYTYVKKNNYSVIVVSALYRFIKIVCQEVLLENLPCWNYNFFEKVFDTYLPYQYKYNIPIYDIVFCVLRGIPLDKFFTTAQPATRMLFNHCTIQFMQRVDVVKLEHIKQLLVDCPDWRAHIQYNSMRELQAGHDAHALATQEAFIKTKQFHEYNYDAAFVTAMNALGLRLPVSNYELHHRGKLHHNCIANYITKHESNNAPLTRILIDDASNGTAELLFVCHQHSSYAQLKSIIEMRIVQYKGPYNRNIAYNHKLFSAIFEKYLLNKDSAMLNTAYDI